MGTTSVVVESVANTMVDGSRRAVGLMGCNNPYLREIIVALLEMSAASVAGSGAGGPSTFVRTCSASRSQTQCACIEREARAAIPGIRTETYAREIFPRITNANPVVGLKVAMVCGVGNY